MSVEPYEAAQLRFPWSLISPPRTAEDFRHSVIGLSLYSAATGVVLIAYLMIAFWHALWAPVGVVGVALLASAILMVLFSTGLWIRMRWLRRFGRVELACIALVLLSLNVGTDICWVAMLPKRTVLSALLVSGITIFWAIISLRYLLRARDFADRTSNT